MRGRDYLHNIDFSDDIKNQGDGSREEEIATRADLTILSLTSLPPIDLIIMLNAERFQEQSRILLKDEQACSTDGLLGARKVEHFE